MGKKLWHLPGISNVLVAVGKSKVVLAGVVKAGAGAAIETSIAAAEGARTIKLATSLSKSHSGVALSVFCGQNDNIQAHANS
ncbi:Unknown protein sequence [Pseudomonas amygdali pv. morsprunorum]|uniref:hypothetical protein n=1 Tax=Pseudomonas amygdali TaxID=47877 RepID=UPI0006CC6058|nr:hypothetical protein [Pseudomonas amygdali]KPC57363.1 Unknown protein sequence [Pseudomonas amygdali pv. morsprunorum]